MLNLLAVLLLIQPRILLVFFTAMARCWPVVSSLLTRAPTAFPAELPPRQAVSSPYHCRGLFLPECRTSHLL